MLENVRLKILAVSGAHPLQVIDISDTKTYETCVANIIHQ